MVRSTRKVIVERGIEERSCHNWARARRSEGRVKAVRLRGDVELSLSEMFKRLPSRNG